MASPTTRIISECTHIKFDVGANSYSFLAEEAPGFVLGLQVSADKTSLQFKEVVACRALVLVQPENNLLHETSIWFHKGPFTSEQFLGMIKYEAGISNKEWLKHLWALSS